MALLPHVEQALVVYPQHRTSRRYRADEHGPLPTIADQRLFMLTYVKQNPIQEVPGQRLGMSQSHANTWIHLLHPVLNHALADQALLPTRTADDLAAMLATSPTDASAPSSLLFMGGRNGPSSVRKTRRSRKTMTGASTCHTLKNRLVIKETGHVCVMSHTYDGKASDKSMAERAG